MALYYLTLVRILYTFQVFSFAYCQWLYIDVNKTTICDKSLFWHRMWLDCDLPKTGVVAYTMRPTRADYYYTIRKIIKDEESIVRECVAAAMLDNNDPELLVRS